MGWEMFAKSNGNPDFPIASMINTCPNHRVMSQESQSIPC